MSILFCSLSSGLQTNDDTLQIGELLAELRQVPMQITSADVERTVSSAHTFAVARDQGTIVGMAVLYVLEAPHTRFGHVELVVVDPKYRGRSVGKGLMEYLISEARRAEVHVLQLTSNQTNPARLRAGAMYTALGFFVPSTTFFRLQL